MTGIQLVRDNLACIIAATDGKKKIDLHDIRMICRQAKEAQKEMVKIEDNLNKIKGEK